MEFWCYYLRMIKKRRNIHRANTLKRKNILYKEREEMSSKMIEQIERAKQEWEATVDSLSELVCLLDNQGCIIRANRTIEQWNLGQVMEIRGKRFHELFHSNCSEPKCYLKTFLSRAFEEISQGNSSTCEIEDNILKRHLSIQIRPIPTQRERKRKKTGSFAVIIVDDITERKRIEESLKERNRELSLLNDMSDLLQELSYEKETYRVVINICEQLFPSDSGGLFMLNNTKNELKIVDFWGTPPPKPYVFDANDCRAVQNNICLSEDSHTEFLCPHLSSCHHGTYLCAPVSTSKENLGIISLCCSQNDLNTADQHWQQKINVKRMVLNRVAKHYALFLVNLRLHERDHLTGLYNRLYMEESLEHDRRRVERRNTAMLMIDIDHFKIFNDHYGHEAGDLVLRHLGMLLRSKIRSEDIACRYGGEEFLLIMPNSTLEIAAKRAEELRLDIMNLRVAYRETPLNITISIGVAALPYHGISFKDAVRAADIALNQAKSSGRNRVVIASY